MIFFDASVEITVEQVNDVVELCQDGPVTHHQLDRCLGNTGLILRLPRLQGERRAFTQERYQFVTRRLNKALRMTAGLCLVARPTRDGWELKDAVAALDDAYGRRGSRIGNVIPISRRDARRTAKQCPPEVGVPVILDPAFLPALELMDEQLKANGRFIAGMTEQARKMVRSEQERRLALQQLQEANQRLQSAGLAPVQGDAA